MLKTFQVWFEAAINLDVGLFEYRFEFCNELPTYLNGMLEEEECLVKIINSIFQSRILIRHVIQVVLESCQLVKSHDLPFQGFHLGPLKIVDAIVILFTDLHSVAPGLIKLQLFFKTRFVNEHLAVQELLLLSFKPIVCTTTFL